MLRTGKIGSAAEIASAARASGGVGSAHRSPSRTALADAVSAIAVENDREAFALLFRHFAPRIQRYVLSLGANRADAEEVAQDAMLTIWRKAASFDRSRASVTTWIHTIARNRRIDVVRRERRPSFDPSEPVFTRTEAVAPDAALSAIERQESLDAAVKRLPPEQVELVQEAYYLAKTYAEIAEQKKLPLGTVKSRMRLAFARLRRTLLDENIHNVQL